MADRCQLQLIYHACQCGCDIPVTKPLGVPIRPQYGGKKFGGRELMPRDASQVQLLYEQLLSGPKTAEDFERAGINIKKLTCRMTDLRHWLQRQGMDWLNHNGTYELVVPQ